MDSSNVCDHDVVILNSAQRASVVEPVSEVSEAGLTSQ